MRHASRVKPRFSLLKNLDLLLNGNTHNESFPLMGKTQFFDRKNLGFPLNADTPILV